MSSIRIATIQLNSGNDVAKNLSDIATHTAQAASDGAQLACLPENACLMPANQADAQAHAHIESNHPMLDSLRNTASTHNIWLAAGSVPVLPDSGTDQRIFNRSYLIAPDGTIHSRYNKIHLYDADLGESDSSGGRYRESSTYQPGKHAVLAQTSLANIGLSICYDLRFPHLYRRLAKAGAQILLIPAAFTRVTGEKHWHILLRARAIETGCFVIAAAQMGTHPSNRQTYGHSLVIAPNGDILSDSNQTQGSQTTPLDLTQITTARESVPCLKHDQQFIVKKHH